ncbi:MAG: AI-2E family transporter [Xanthomonadales bacterium]|nr:AI-2E family transporter [Gammaproteobacteria bacterium]MBT8057072.1 AI-2E family transporter [Gammaproteobacteria bacterium]NNJ78711.1 AI-2E family transporter [Xanthomonadales bacterium]NNL05528.1 AI-2E family transporter [Xanthomonadales bacterium]
MELLRDWFRRSFSDPQVVILGVFLVVFFAVVVGLGAWLAPMFASIVIAYLLEAMVVRLTRLGMPRMLAVVIVFILFLTLLVFLLFGLIPLVSRQLSQLVQQFPNYISQGQVLLKQLPQAYPELISVEQAEAIVAQLGQEAANLGQQILGWSLESVASIIGLVVYVILVPVLVFFFLKDKDMMIGWITDRMPKDRTLVNRVWVESEAQIANYVRGKVVEIIIVGAVTYVTFMILGLQYAALLATLVGFSVLVPYVGAAVVTIPIGLLAYFQFGWGWEFGQVMIAYAIIQALDGNLLVPLLFSEVVNLHPVAIILAILVFGGVWGFWGIFFAIPLATFVKAVINAWPRSEKPEAGAGTEEPSS